MFFKELLHGLTETSLLAFTVTGLLGTMSDRAFYYMGIKRIGAARSDAIRASQALQASMASVLVIGETATTVHVVSMVCILAGVALIFCEYGHPDEGASNGELAGLALPLTVTFLDDIQPTFAKFGFAEGASTLTGLVAKTGSASVEYLLYLV